MIENNNFHHVNPELFKGQAPSELTGETYYAYLDSVEKIDSITYLRFDCILKKYADSVSIDKETILNLPSIIIELSGKSDKINEKFNTRGRFSLYNLESRWMVIKTSLRESAFTQKQYFNFIQVGNPEISNNYDFESVILPRYLDSDSQTKIREIVSATTLDESTEQDVKSFLDTLPIRNLSHVNVYNVGQGNCNALVTINNQPLIYFDIGGGFGANKSSYPANFRICTTRNPPVILSHWDVDHIQTAVVDSRILDSKWLVPKHKSISSTAMHIAQTLINRGNLVCWNSSITHYEFSNHRIVKCSGIPSSKNNSGLALFVNYGTNKFVILPGDATFSKIPHYPTGDFIGLVASHHGAKASINGMPLSAGDLNMLAYSYGQHNTHNHPHILAQSTYQANGWSNRRDTINGSIAMKSSPCLLDVPCCNTECSLDVLQHY
jgi:hypothetical protein